jgi:hypothetical protein
MTYPALTAARRRRLATTHSTCVLARFENNSIDPSFPFVSLQTK